MFTSIKDEQLTHTNLQTGEATAAKTPSRRLDYTNAYIGHEKRPWCHRSTPTKARQRPYEKRMHSQLSTHIATEVYSTQLTRPREENSSRVPTNENHQQDLTKGRTELHRPSALPEHKQVIRQHWDSFFISCKRGESNLPHRPRGQRGTGMMIFHTSYIERRNERASELQTSALHRAENLDFTLLRLEEDTVDKESREPKKRSEEALNRGEAEHRGTAKWEGQTKIEQFSEKNKLQPWTTELNLQTLTAHTNSRSR